MIWLWLSKAWVPENAHDSNMVLICPLASKAHHYGSELPNGVVVPLYGMIRISCEVGFPNGV